MGLPAEMNFSFAIPRQDGWKLTFLRSELTESKGKREEEDNAPNRISLVITKGSDYFQEDASTDLDSNIKQFEDRC
jgi:hypothetical protein